MPAYYHIDRERKLVMSTASGVLTAQDIASHMQRLLQDPDFNPCFSQLADFSHISTFQVTTDDIRDFARQNVFDSNARRAFVVSDDATEALAEMFAVLRDTAGERGIRVFRTLEEGVNWIAPRVASY